MIGATRLADDAGIDPTVLVNDVDELREALQAQREQADRGLTF